MVAGAEQPDPVQHGIEVLVAVTDEPRAMPLPAIDALAPVPGVGAQQLLQQRGAQPGHRSADRQLHCDLTSGFRALFDQPASMVEDAFETIFEIGFIGGPDPMPPPSCVSKQRSRRGIDGHGVFNGGWSAARRLALAGEPI